MTKAEFVKLLFLTDDLGGGTGNHLLSMLKHWDKQAWRIKIVSKIPSLDRVAPDVPVETIPAPRLLNRLPFTQLKAMNWLRNSLGKNAPAPDLIHSFFFWSIIYGRLLKRMGKVKALIENREDTGFAWGVHEYAWLRATRMIPDRVVCVSEAVREVVLEREKLDKRRVVVIHNGIDPLEQSGESGYLRQELGLSEEHLVVGMVANYNRPVKGFTYLLDAIPAIVSEVPSARFLFVGGVDALLKEKVKALEIGRFITFAGYRKDINQCYEAMDLSVLTSLSEGLSITLLESMNHGLPVVATRVGGNPELVEDGKSGYLVPPKDAQALANRIVQLLRSEELRRRMGEEGRRRVESGFQMQDVAGKYQELYKCVLFDA